jgi:hypothetical protein
VEKRRSAALSVSRARAWKESLDGNTQNSKLGGESGHSKATDFVRPFLTASSVIAVMPACMLTVPNPCARSEWPAHCDGEIHYVWPFKFGAGLAFVIILAIAAHIPRKQNKAVKQHH